MHFGIQVEKFRKIDRLQTSVRVRGPPEDPWTQDEEAGACGSRSAKS